jgi:putative Mn2+ efflux pump MntP
MVRQSSGFSDVVASFKRQLPAPLSFDLSATAGLGFPSASTRVSGHGYQPYIQFPWSHEISGGWGMAGMFTVAWFPREPVRNPTFEPTISLERALGRSADMFFEYVGDHDHIGLARCWIQVANGDSQRSSNSIFMLVSASTAARSIIISALDIHSAWAACLEDLLLTHPDLVAFGRVFAVAFAVGLDVFAISVAVGTEQLNRNASVRVGMALASAEIVMQMVGYGLGTGANRIFGEVAVYVGFALLAGIGVMMFGNSFQHSSEAKFDATHGVGLLIASLSISLDSLGIGIALPALGIPLLPPLATVSITTTVFTLIGLSFGARLGERYERNAERAAGVILVVLAVLFAFERRRSHF